MPAPGVTAGTKHTVALGGRRSHWHKPAQHLPTDQPPGRGRPGGSADSQGNARHRPSTRRLDASGAVLTCVLMSWGYSGGKGRKNKVSAQQTGSPAVPHPPTPWGLGATQHRRAVPRKSPRLPAARLLPGETGIYTEPAYPAGEPGHHHHNADVGPLIKPRQSFPFPDSNHRCCNQVRGASWTQPASQTASLLGGDAQLGPAAAPSWHTPPLCPYLGGCEHVRLRPVNPDGNLCAGGAELLEEAAICPDPQVVFSDLHLRNRGQTSTALCHAEPAEEHLRAAPELPSAQPCQSQK